MDFDYQTYADARMADYAPEAQILKLQHVANTRQSVSADQPNWATRLLLSLGVLCPQTEVVRA